MMLSRSRGAPGRRRRLLPCAGPRVLPALAALLLAASAAAPARAEPAGPAVKVLAFGDSLTAGYGLPGSAAFPAVLQAALRRQGRNVTVIDGGVSGDTASGGLARLDWTLAEGADLVIVELGANDMLRGIDPAVTKTALDGILAKLAARKVKVLLAGMRAAPSLGQPYVSAFDALYPALATAHNVPLYPFFLDGMVEDAGQKLADGLHPNARGVETIVGRILPSVDAALDAPAPKS